MLYNINKFCSEIPMQLSELDADLWLAFDRATRIEFVRAWWLDHDDKGFTSMTGADACAEFFHSKQNSIRGLQTEAFKGITAPWQKGYVSGWREAVAALKAEDEHTRKITDADHATTTNALMNMAEQPAPETKAKTKRQPKAPKAPKRALSWVRINSELHPATPGSPICVCPSCKIEAFTHEQVAQIFSIRYDNKDRTKPRPQSLCGACRTKSAREKRERDRAQLPVPGTV